MPSEPPRWSLPLVVYTLQLPSFGHTTVEVVSRIIRVIKKYIR